MSRRLARGEAMVGVLFWLAVIALLCAVGFGVQLLRAGGDVGCAFSQDPALCVAVKQSP